jgi:metal-dependent amidase/aminoacylase/carboxypeptidase family protein
MPIRVRFTLLAALACASTLARPADLAVRAEQRAQALQEKVIAWRRDIHQHSELSNREVRTAKRVADHLRALGIEVRTGVAHPGVIGVPKGGKPGPVVALRADMDALPVVEEVRACSFSSVSRRKMPTCPRPHRTTPRASSSTSRV